MKRTLKWHSLWVLSMLMLLAVFTVPASALSGTGTEADPYVISSAADLSLMHTDLEAHYVLGSDIDLTGYTHDPVGNEWEGAFTGSLDGRGYTISHLTVDLEIAKYVGLFGYLEGSVSNLKFSQVDITGGRYTGTVAGFAADISSISNCEVLSGELSVSWLVADDTCLGGIVGKSCGALNDCRNAADVQLIYPDSHSLPKAYVGGIAGRISSDDTMHLADLENRGSISVSSGAYSHVKAGGLIGCADAFALTDCANSGAVSDGKDTGGLVAYSESAASFTSCVNSGSISNNHSSYTSHTGGLMGYSGGTADFTSCVNSGSISTATTVSNDLYTGGLMGYGATATFTSCVNSGNITSSAPDYSARAYAAGFVPYLSASHTFTSCTNSGIISGKICGIFTPANYSAHISQSLNTGWIVSGKPGVDIDLSCVSISSVLSNTQSAVPLLRVGGIVCGDLRGGTAADPTLAEMQQRETYPNLDFIAGWSMDPMRNNGMPTPNGIPADYMDQSVLILEKGDSGTVTAPFTADTWEISDSGIVLCENGTITALATGSAVVRAAAHDGRQANCVVFVYESRTLTLSSTELKLTPGEVATLRTDVPAEDPQAIHWISSDESIASVDSSGRVTAQQKAGIAVITARLPLSGTSMSCTVTVTGNPVSSITLPNQFTVQTNTPTALSYTVNPTVYSGTLRWESSDESVLTVENAVVTGHKAGTATVTVTSENNRSATCLVTVKQPCQELTLDRTELTLELGYTDQLKATMLPADCTDTVSWSTSNYHTVSVSPTGELTPGQTGKAVITATSSSGQRASCIVTVIRSSVLPTSVTLDQTLLRLAVGEKVTLNAAVLPSNATDQTLHWSSSNPAVAAVNSTGVVEALSPGTAEIRVTTANGLYDVCEVRVAQVSSAAFVLTGARIQTEHTAATEIHITKNPGISAFSVDVNYDAAHLTPVAVEAGALLGSGTLTSNVDTAAEDGYLAVTWYSAADITEDGLAFTVSWEAGSETVSVPLSLSYEAGNICNSEKIEVGFAVEEGLVEIIDYMIGDIYPDSALNMKDIVYFARWFNGQEELSDSQQLCADVFHDGALDTKDLTALAQLLNQQMTLPEAQTLRILTPLAAPELYEISVAEGEVDENGDVLLTVLGQNCPGVAAFRFLLEAPEGYEITEVLPGKDLPQSAAFLYTEETNVVSWYQSGDAELNGVLFIVRLHTDSAEPQRGTLRLHHVGADFFSAESFENVPVSVGAGSIRVPLRVTFQRAVISGSQIRIDVEANASASALLVTAYYSNSGKLLRTGLRSITLTDGTVTCYAASPAAGEQCKLFLLSTGTYKPLCPVASPTR